MAKLEKKNAEELCALYDLEPTLRDVYVEGPSDANFLRWFFSEAKLPDVIVYDIETVSIPEEVLSRNRLGNGKRDKVIGLALLIEESIPNDSGQITCVVDLDLDILFGVVIKSPYLFFTDLGCMEMYALDDDILTKFLHIVAGRQPSSVNTLRQNLMDIIGKSGLMRATKKSLGWDLPSIDIDRCCVLQGDIIEFNADEAIKRALLTRGKTKQADEYSRRLNELRATAPADQRLFGNGHELTDLLSWYIRKWANNQTITTKHVQKYLHISLEYEWLLTQNLFATLVTRCA